MDAGFVPASRLTQKELSRIKRALERLEEKKIRVLWCQFFFAQGELRFAIGFFDAVSRFSRSKNSPFTAFTP